LKKYFIFIAASLISINTLSQEINNKNRVYLEFLGKGLFYSMNYEREIIHTDININMNISAGISVFPGLTSLESSVDLFLPFEINGSYSFGNHHAAIGYGTTFWKYKINYIEIDNTNLSQQPVEPSLVVIREWFAHLCLEYRYMKPEGGLMLKAGYTPLFFAETSNSQLNKSINYQTSFNLGIGWTF